MNINLAVLALVTILFAPGSCAAKSDDPVATSLCDLIKNYQSFDGKIVKVRARVRSDGLEHTDLIDKSCPGVSASLESTHWDTVPGADILNDALMSDGPHTSQNRLVFATFVGVLKIDPLPYQMRKFYVDKIIDIVVQ